MQRQLQRHGRVQPSIDFVRWTPIAGLAAGLAIALVPASTASASPVLTLRADGTVVTREDPYLPPAQAMPRVEAVPRAPKRSSQPRRKASRAPATLRAKRKTVRSELRRLLKAGALSSAEYKRYRSIYANARTTRSKLRGARRVALSAPIINLARIARAGRLSASRVPALLETVRRNRAWWSNGRLLGGGQRVAFEGSELVWQYYAGQGLQIQWLGTFGRANALWSVTKKDAALRVLLDEALRLAAGRAGGIAFEYLFRFGGGSPPWVSGLAQGTAIQALSRAAAKLNEPRYMQAARRALGIFRRSPSTGVGLRIGSGTHYLIYSYARGLRVLNAFAQALNGLYDYTALSGDPEGRALFARGEAQLRRELPRYDTGAWSRYSFGVDSNLNYHTLSRDFLRSLCKKLEGENAATAAPGVSAEPYCSAGDRFSAYLKRDPTLKLVSRSVRAGRPASVRLRVSKPSFVKVAIYRQGSVVAVMTAHVSGGRRSLRWARPRFRGDYRVKLRATDLAGNVGTAEGDLRVLKRRK